jgi:hypothetical protein
MAVDFLELGIDDILLALPFPASTAIGMVGLPSVRHCITA